MFSFLYSEEKKMRRAAANWLELAERVHHYRRDQLSETQLQKLLNKVAELRQRLKERSDAGRLKLATEALERELRESGGRHYPVSSFVENVEFFLVAAIVILGLRAYFVQPFKIPTNSMWPSYYGMTHESFAAGDEPGLLRKAARLLTLGATHYSANAPADGEVLVPVVFYSQNYARIMAVEKPGRTMLLLPTTVREYSFSVGGEQTRIEVPADFDFERVLEEQYAGPGRQLSSHLVESAKRHWPLESSTMSILRGGQLQVVQVYWVSLGKKVARGESLASFDILTGDLLFVDRIWYQFVRPRVGQGFVFKTENIHSPEMQDAAGEQIRQYYVKRLVGTPGDRLEIKQPVLWRNSAPIGGAAAFGENAQQEGNYPGYTNDGLLAAGKVVTVPNDFYFALGDNSPRSKDGRAWGFVPKKDVVGSPLFIYYPLTKRWGFAH